MIQFMRDSHSSNPKAFWWEMISALAVTQEVQY